MKSAFSRLAAFSPRADAPGHISEGAAGAWRTQLCCAPASFRRAYHNDTVLVRVAERFNISKPRDWYRLNRMAVIKEFSLDEEVTNSTHLAQL